MSFRSMVSTLVFGLLLTTTQRGSADWRQFRGIDSSAVALDSKLPAEWVDGDKPQNIAWKLKLPGRGLGSPIVVNGRVFVTCSSGFAQDRLHVLCFDAAKGTKLWERQ